MIKFRGSCKIMISNALKKQNNYLIQQSTANKPIQLMVSNQRKGEL